MSADQIAISLVLCVTMILFVWNRWRYDIVAGAALLSSVFLGVVPAEHAFEGFAHPAVITVACVMVISQALQYTGVIDFFLKNLSRMRGTLTTQIAANAGMTAMLSAFMNNVGALALMLPVTVRDARSAKRSPHLLLMPLSFASLLGGLVTLIGTPPNIVIATFRADISGTPFGMFDYMPVGLTVAVGGIAFIVFIGWRLIPQRGHDELDSPRHFSIADYVTEARVRSGSTLVGATIGELEALCENELNVLAMIRGGRRIYAPRTLTRLLQDDVLILQGDSAALQPLLDNPGLVRLGVSPSEDQSIDSADVRLIEAVVMPNTVVEGQSMRAVRLHSRFGVNLLAVSRQDNPVMTRLGHIRFNIGDVLLLQGERNRVSQVIQTLGLLPLARRGFEVKQRKSATLTVGIFAASILATALGLLPVQIAFASAVLLLVLVNAIPLRQAYRSIEWPVIMLLGCLIPIGEALQTTATTDLIAAGLLASANDLPVHVVLVLLMVTSMVLSDLVHNTPTAVLMAPVAASLAEAMTLSVDACLMAVAIGAASPYLTPIGHQSNTLVMGPGGYRFGDYWRMGLPLDLVIITIAVPMIMWVWP